jgi:hypothetical protein
MDSLREHVEKDGFSSARAAYGADRCVFGCRFRICPDAAGGEPRGAENVFGAACEPPGIRSVCDLLYAADADLVLALQIFRRFGTHDLGTIAINALLLFVVLFFVYPLKFLFTMVSYWAMGLGTASFDSVRQVRKLMVIYGLGFMAIYLLFAALYLNGYRPPAAAECAGAVAEAQLCGGNGGERVDGCALLRCGDARSQGSITGKL